MRNARSLVLAHLPGRPFVLVAVVAIALVTYVVMPGRAAADPPATATTAAAPAPATPPDECVQRDGRTCVLASGVRYVELRAGKGVTPRAGAKVTVHYTGTFTNGKKFDSSRGKRPWSFVWGKGQVIPGYELGLATARVGARRKLTVPPEYAYGPKGFKNIIPPNATLVFDVELLSVK